MKHLYLVHVGYYDQGLGNGLYESHSNMLVAAENFEDARTQAKDIGLKHGQRVHIDGMMRVEGVAGHRVDLVADASLENSDRFVSNKDRELAPKPAV
ncbi:MAG: DUF1543 domain-containing protein [Bdellovibrionota bacterium]